MKILVLLTIAIVSTASAGDDLHPLSDEYINLLNSRQSTWEAGRNFPESTPLSEIRVLMGVLKNAGNKTLPLKVHVEDTPIPESFDARTYWPKCSIIKQIRDQSACGSCWAVAAVSAMSDRICIHSDGAKQVPISATDLMACCWWNCGSGCNGGLPNEAWDYWVKYGIVTGGEYNSNVGCKPYPFPQCGHHATGNKKPCPTNLYETPKCFTHCDEPSTIAYEQDKSYGESSYAIGKDVKQIQLEILKNGPVETSFDVYNDFVNYKKGVYVKTDNTMMGAHAVRIIGWGTENNVPYWLIANSWNEDWGDRGLFKIRRGTNECFIESGVVAGMPKL